MLDIKEYDNDNILFLKKYFFNKEQKIIAFLVKSLTKQRDKLITKNKGHLARMDKLDDLTTGVVWIDNVELFLGDATINETSYKDIKKTLFEVSYGGVSLRSYNQISLMKGILEVYESNKYTLEKVFNNYKQLMKVMKAQEKSIKKFIKVLYEFNFTKAKIMSEEQITRFFKSRFKEFEFI